MKKLALFAATAALTAASPAAFAGYTSSTSLLTGYVSVENFRDTNLNAFDVVLRDLSGTVNVTVPPNGVYSVDVSGAVNLTFAPPPAPQINVAIPLPTNLFTGALIANGLAAGSYTVPFSAGVLGQNDTFLGNVGFSIDYNGQISSQAKNLITQLTGFVFAGNTGAGTLTVSGKLFTDGAQLNVVESNLDWIGFGALIAAADNIFHPTPDNFADGTFVLRNGVVHIPEPTSMALVGLGLTGLAALRRRKAA